MEVYSAVLSPYLCLSLVVSVHLILAVRYYYSFDNNNSINLQYDLNPLELNPEYCKAE